MAEHEHNRREPGAVRPRAMKKRKGESRTTTMDKAKGGKEAPDALVRVEDLADLMQRAVTVVRQALSFASQHIPSTGGERLVGGRTRCKHVHDKSDGAMSKHLIGR